MGCLGRTLLVLLVIVLAVASLGFGLIAVVAWMFVIGAVLGAVS